MSDEPSSSIPVKPNHKPHTGNVIPSYPLLLRGMLILMVGFLVSLVFNAIFLSMLQSRAEVKPWVVSLTPQGDLATLGMTEFETTPDLVFQFVSYSVPRLYFVDGDKQPGLKELSTLIDERILSKQRRAFEASKQSTATGAVVMQAAATRLIVGTAEERSFAISKKHKKVYCMVEGRFSMTSKSRNFSDPVRWDIEMEIVAPTNSNRWGLRVTQIHERSVKDPALVIPPAYIE